MSRRKLYDYASALHQRGLSTETHGPLIKEVILGLMARREMPRAGDSDTWQERVNAKRLAIIAEIDRRNGVPDAE